MALEVEDGTGKTDANAYVSLATVNAYFTARGIDTWTDLDDAEKEAAIVRATFALDAKYARSWIGVKKTQAQTLQWPRIKEKDSTKGVTDVDGYEVLPTTIPQQVLNACCEVALIEVSERFLAQAVTRDDSVSSERVGPISTSWFQNAPSVSHYPHIDAMLEGLASTGAGAQINVYLTDREKNQEEGSTPFDFPEYFHIVKYE